MTSCPPVAINTKKVGPIAQGGKVDHSRTSCGCGTEGSRPFNVIPYRVPIRTVGCSGTLPLSLKSTRLQWKITILQGAIHN